MIHISIHKLIGQIKDQTSINIAKITTPFDARLETLIINFTSHNNDPPNPTQFGLILSIVVSSSKPLMNACIWVILKRIKKTHDWIVALKCLILLHWLMIEGDEMFKVEIEKVSTSTKGGVLSRLLEFKGQNFEFVRRYGEYIDERIDLLAFDKMWLKKRLRTTSHGDEFSGMSTERVLIRMEELQSLLERILACRVSLMRRNHYKDSSKIVTLALCNVIEDSFHLYSEICQGLLVLLHRFWDMEYGNCAKTYGMYVTLAMDIDELVDFYGWFKGVEIDKCLNYPQVTIVSDEFLRSLEGFVKRKRSYVRNERESLKDKHPIGLMLQFDTTPRLTVEDSTNLLEDVEASFKEMMNYDAAAMSNWEECLDIGKLKASTWEIQEANTADWERTLMETASDLEKQKNEYYDWLAEQMVNQDLFAASLTIPATCVEIAENEKQYELMMMQDEEQLGQQYELTWMSGQVRVSQNGPWFDEGVSRATIPYGLSNSLQLPGG